MQLFLAVMSVLKLIIYMAVGAAMVWSFFKFVFFPCLNKIITEGSKNWWVTPLYSSIIGILGLFWVAIIIGIGNYIYVDTQTMLPNIQFSRDLEELGERSRSAVDQVKTVPTRVPDPDTTLTPPSNPSATPDGASNTGSAGRPCESGWCPNSMCPDGCGNVGSPGWICRGGVWQGEGMAAWNAAKPCPYGLGK